MRGLEFDPHGRADQIEFLSEASFQKALVGVGDVLERIAVDDDHRWVHATLVRIAQLINLTSKNKADLLSMHLQQQPHCSRAQVEINIVCQQEVAVRLQNQYAKQIEVTNVWVRVGSSGELLLANEEMY